MLFILEADTLGPDFVQVQNLQIFGRCGAIDRRGLVPHRIEITHIDGLEKLKDRLTAAATEVISILVDISEAGLPAMGAGYIFGRFAHGIMNTGIWLYSAILLPIILEAMAVR